ncbi:MAG TPA: hypothetical protein VIR26_06675 [Metalysinibacillus sp.]
MLQRYFSVQSRFWYIHLAFIGLYIMTSSVWLGLFAMVLGYGFSDWGIWSNFTFIFGTGFFLSLYHLVINFIGVRALPKEKRLLTFIGYQALSWFWFSLLFMILTTIRTFLL